MKLYVVLAALAWGYVEAKQAIEEVPGRDVAGYIEEHDYLAVYWVSKSCKVCDRQIQVLEKLLNELNEAGVQIIKVNDKKIAKQHSIAQFPTLTYFKGGEPNNYHGDLTNEASLLDFLASPEAMDMPDLIEEVNAAQLEKVINEKTYVAVLFYNQMKESKVSLGHLENIDDNADKLGIAFVKINDLELVDEYSLGELPALVYYRHATPILYEGDLNNENVVLEWLIQNRSTGDEEDVIEEVDINSLETMISSVETMAVLFYDGKGAKKTERLMEVLEKIDDDCDARGLHFVKIGSEGAVDAYGIEKVPTLVFYRNEVPNVFEGNLLDGPVVLQWLLSQLESDEIEDVTATMLERLIRDTHHLVVLFYRRHDPSSAAAVELLETIDDDLDRHRVIMVKTGDAEAVEEYGIEEVPAIVYFEKGIPFIYPDQIHSAPDCLRWIIQQVEGSYIEDVNDAMLDRLIAGDMPVGAIFYEREEPDSEQVLEALEAIDDDCDRNGIVLVKIADKDEATEYGIDETPALVYIESGIPHLFDGDLFHSDEVLNWLIHQMKADEIEEVTGEMLDKLLDNKKYIAAIFYERDDPESERVLSHLENIDDDAEKSEIYLVKLSYPADAQDHAIHKKPSLVFFKNKEPVVFEGDMGEENEVLRWMMKLLDKGDVIPKAKEKPKVVESGKKQEAKQETVKKGHVVKESVKKETIKKEPEVKTEPVKKEAVKKEAVKKEPAKKEPIKKEIVTKESPKPPKPAASVQKPSVPPTRPAMIHKTAQPAPPPPAQKAEAHMKPQRVKKSKKVVYDEDLDDDGFPDGVEDTDGDGVPDHEEDWDGDGIPDVEEDMDGDGVEDDLEDSDGDGIPDAEEDGDGDGIPDAEEDEDGDGIPDDLEDDDGDGIPNVQEKPKKAKKGSETTEKFAKAEESRRKLAESLTDDRKVKKVPEAAPLKKSEPKKAATKSKVETPRAEKPAVEKKTKKVETIEELTPIDKIDDDDDDDDALEDTRSDTVKTLQDSPNVVAFFFESLDKVATKIVGTLARIEEKFKGKDIIFMNIDANEISDLAISNVPSLVYFKNGEPVVYEENLMNEESILTFIDEELKSNQNVIEDFDLAQLHNLISRHEFVLVYLYTSDCDECDEAIKQLEQIDDDTDAIGVKFVKTDDPAFMKEYGITHFPQIIYFENKNPSIYDGDPAEETELLTWLLYQMKEDTIENINRDLLFKMVDENEFLAVFFYTDNDDSVKMLRHLELIDDEASEYGVVLTKIDDPLMSKKYGHRDPPGLGYFRKGNYIKYDGDNFDDEEMLDWLTDPNVMEISDQIEKVNTKMFEKLKTRNDYLAVLFYSEDDCKQCGAVLQELENIDDEAESAGVPIVKLEDKQLAKSVGVFALPSIVIFKNYGEDAVIYAGDIKNEAAILEWLLVQKDPSNEAIEDLDGDQLRKMIQHVESVAVLVYTSEGCDNCLEVLQKLENIDDDTDRQNIHMVKTTDEEFAAEVGITEFPGLVTFNDGIPNVYEGDLEAEEEVLDWLIEMKVESHIELITRPMLENMVEEIQYLAVFFFKQNCRTCDQILAELENIDDECDVYGIQMVKLQDPQLAKRYGIKTFPSLVYFRNGNPLTFDGDLKSEEAVLEWLVDDDNRELDDEIEAVNYRMLDKLLETSPFMAVFFYDEDCTECDGILEALETIDDEADIYGIDFVKNDDPQAAKQYNIYNTPALVYFRKKSPIVYDGDLMDEEAILSWLTSQDVFEIKDEIEEVNRKMLEKLLDENDFVAVYFYDDECVDCAEVLSGLERIDQETDALDITFVKINDPRYAKKYGVNRLPALVYFRRKFPSIYRDDLREEAEVLDWLQRNRYKNVELDIFMYAILGIAVAFFFYTAFLMFGLKTREVEKKKED